MKITKIELQKKRPRYNLEVDGNFLCSISATTLTHLNLYKEKELSELEIDSLIKTELENRFFDRLVDLLSSRLKTEYQAKQYLKKLAFDKKGKWFNEDYKDFDLIFENVINRVEKLNLLNDETFAIAFVESRMRSKPRGSSFLVNELISKGINNQIAKKIVSELVPENDDMIYRVFKKKFGDIKLDKQNRKHVDFLLRKGFDWDDISKLEKTLKDEQTE